MEFIMIFLVIIIIILLTYLFLLHNELKMLPKQIEYIRSIDSNTLIHSKYNLKKINSVISRINDLIKETKQVELDYNIKNKALMRMMTNISHDLRTPLTSALGYVDIVLKSNISVEEKQKELHTVEERLKKLEELINSFFEFSKIISSNKNPELEKINLKSVLEECIINYYEDYKKDNREITLECKQIKVIIDSNKILLSRIFDNLIGNAYKHSTKNLDIKIIVNDNIKIVFLNDLPNKELDIERIFDEFYTVDISRTKGGTGLGLAIAKEFTEQLGGKIYAKKEEESLKIVIELFQESNSDR